MSQIIKDIKCSTYNKFKKQHGIGPIGGNEPAGSMIDDDECPEMPQKVSLTFQSFYKFFKPLCEFVALSRARSKIKLVIMDYSSLSIIIYVFFFKVIFQILRSVITDVK